MPNTIILKKSSVAGKVPLSGDLTFGEVALNYADGKIYYKNTTTNIDFVGNGGTYTNVLRIANSTTTITPDTGALVVDGGVGIGGTLHVGGIGHFGLEPTITLANPLAVFTGDVNGYNQIQIQNISTGLLASSDIVATANDGDDTTHYIDMGINNNNFSSVDWTMSGPRDGYIYVAGNNLTLGTDEPGKEVRIHVGGTLAADVVAIFREPGTASTSDITGSFNVNGGAGITGDVHIGETLHIGANPLTALSNTLVIGTANIDGFTQVSIQNRNAGPSASADFVVTADDGNDTTGYIDLGLNNSGYSNVDWTISGPRDGYLYVAGNNLTLGTDSTGTTVKIHVGGTLEENIVATFNEPNTNSTSTLSGSLIVAGGAGIGLDLTVGGTVYSNGVALENFNTSTLVLQAISAQTSTNAAVAYSLANTSTTYVGRAALADTATTATNLAGGAQGSIPYQTSAGTTAFIPIGPDKFVLQSNGTTATWVSTSSLGISGGGGGSSGVSSITAGTDTAISTATGAVTIWNTSTLQSVTSRGATTNQAISITNNTISTSANTGALTVSGGVGISGDVNIDGNLTFAGTATVSAAGGLFFGDDYGFGALYAGIQTFTQLEQTVVQITANTSTFAQVNFQNINSGTEASGDIVLTSSNGDQTTGYIDLGINSENYNASAYSAQGPNDGYLYVVGADLVIGTASSGTTVKIHVGDTVEENVVARFNEPNTISTSTNSGALVVTGGAGVSGNLYVGGTINGNLTGTATNATTATNADKWTTGRTITLGGDLTGNITIDGSTNVILTATIASNSVELGTDTIGNYVATGATSGFGLSGSTSTEGGTFTVTSNATSTNATSTIVYRDGSGNFSAGTITAQAISVTNNTAATSTTTGALVVTGGAGIGGNVHIGGNIVVRDTAIVGNASTTSVLTAAVTIDSFAAATYRSAQYIISVSNVGLGEYQTSDVLVVHNGTNSFVQATSVFTGNKALLNYSTIISGGNVLLQGTGNQTGANANIVKIQKTYITI